MNAQNIAIFERTLFDVTQEGETIATFNTLEEAQQYVEEITPTDTYSFDPNYWKIKQGEVTRQEALENRIYINTAISFAKANGYTVFDVGDLDAYFDVQAGFGGSKIENYRRSIQLPSNFHFKMNDNTHLRVQPNDKRDYALLCAFSEINVTVSGGHLWGDRYTHDYDNGDTGPQDLGYGLYFVGVVNGVVDNITANQFTGDGFIISSPVVRKDDGSENHDSHYGKVYFSKNLKVTNSTFDDNRRNGLALTDVIGAVLDNNTYSKTGLGGRKSGEAYSWKGHLPKHAIDLEAINNPDENGNLRLTERVENVVISNSIFKENYGDIDFYKCSNIEVFGNTFSSGSGGVGGFNVKMYGNTFLADSEASKTAINVKPLVRADGSHFVKDWEIYNNTISGYVNGIQIGGQNQKVYSNKISEFSNNGIFLLNGVDVLIDNNELDSSYSNARGIYNYPVGIEAQNYTLSNNKVAMTGNYGYGFDFKKVIGENFIIDNCHFSQRVRIANSKNITIKKSTFPTADFSKNNQNIIQENNN